MEVLGEAKGRKGRGVIEKAFERGKSRETEGDRIN